MNQIAEFVFYGLSVNLGVCSFVCWPAMAGYILLSGMDETRDGILPSSATIFLRCLIFFVAKLLSVLVVGLIFYLAKDATKILFAQYKNVFNILTGAAIATFGITLIVPLRTVHHLYKDSAIDMEKNQNCPSVDRSNIFTLGVLSGVMPCGPRVAVIAAAAMGSWNFYDVILKTTAFSLGELAAPFLIWALGAIGSKRVGGLLSFRSQQTLSAALKKIVGALLILQGVRFFFV